MPTILIILAVLVVLVFAAGYYFYRLVVYPKVVAKEETLRIEIENGKVVPAVWDAMQKEEVHITSPHGYDLFALYLPLPGSKKTAIISHGISWSMYGSVKYIDLFRKRGWNVLLWDLRHHGRSSGPDCTFGLTEQFDSKAVADWAFARLGKGGQVGIHGESLGASIALMHAAIDPRLAWVIADCPYSSMEGILAYHIQTDYHLPRFPMLTVASLFFKLKHGMGFENVDMRKAVANTVTPMFFIHGAKDAFTPPGMSLELFRAKTHGMRFVFLAPEAGHAEAFWNNQEKYDELVGGFLEAVANPPGKLKPVSGSLPDEPTS